jgi:lambda-carrageenase
MRTKFLLSSVFYAGIFLLLLSCNIRLKDNPVDSSIHSFPTEGAPVYHLKPGTVEPGGQRVIISASYDGMVQCHTPAGKLLWKTPTGGFFPNDLQVEDLNNDGLDESLIASADGSLYMLDHSGELRWTFSREAPLLSVCVVQAGASKFILTGGVERKIFSLNIDGEVIA